VPGSETELISEQTLTATGGDLGCYLAHAQKLGTPAMPQQL